MLLKYEDKTKRVIKGEEEIKFSSDSGFHLVILKGRAKSEKQLNESATDDEDLTIQIDDKTFPQLANPNRLIDSPAAINGGRSHNFSKTVYFLTNLSGKDHKVILKTDDPVGAATFENLEVHTLDLNNTFTLEPKIQAEDGNRREWITFVLDNLPLNSFTVELNLKRRFLDSDDVKVIVDGQIKRNDRSILHKLWYFAASILTGEIQPETFNVNLLTGLHYIEFWADRMPTLDKVTFNLGSSSGKRIPTVDDPKWTGDFADDSAQIILARAIFGEARSGKLPDEARIAVGWSIRNRVEDSRWQDTYQEVITQDQQYSAFNAIDSNRKYVENPFWTEIDIDKKAWYNCYDIAGKVISGESKDPTNGANHYYDSSISAPYWVTKETLVLTISDIDHNPTLFFHKL